MASKFICGCSALALAFTLFGCSTTERIAQPVATQQQSAAKAIWPQDSSDLEADENVRFGVLPNGMRYAIMRNATPPGSASFRLRIDAGSLHEADDQLGLAHFVEHMALKETRNVPENEFVRILERHGLQFGPDTNATTGFDETVYMLDLPTSNPETVDTALFLMREAVGEALFRAETIDSERGVVLAEERTRAVPNYRAVVDALRFVFRDDLLSERLPIGSADILRNAPSERLADFYEKYYRPEKATFIAVGDFDVAEMEAKVRDRFSDWQGRGEPGPELPEPVLASRGLDTRVFVEPGASSQIRMSWLAPYDHQPDSRAMREERLVRQLGLAVLSRRLQRLSATTAPHIAFTQASRSIMAGRGETTDIIAVSDPAKWRETITTLEQEQRRAMEHGFTQAEVDREITEVRTLFATAVAGASTRPSPQLAQGIVTAVNMDRVYLSPAQSLALLEEAVSGLTAERVTAATREIFAGSGPLIHVARPTPIDGGETALVAAFTQSRAQPVEAPVVMQAKAWPYTDFGTPGAVVERRELAEIGATAIRFSNNVRLTVKPTNFKDDEVLVEVRIGEGRLGLPPSAALAQFAFSNSFVNGGLGQLSFEELREVLAGRVQSVSAGNDDTSFRLSGTTRAEDLPVQLQLLAAYVSDPGWEASAFNRISALGDTLHGQFETSPSGVFGRDVHALLRSGDGRWGPPSREEIAAMTPEAVRNIVDPQLRNGQIEIIIVGDVTVEAAIREAAATFGALAPRNEPATISDRPVSFPKSAVERRTHRGRADQAMAVVAWPARGWYPDQREAQTVNLLAQVLQLRLNEHIRERLGVAYNPSASHVASQDFDYGYLSARAEIPPGEADNFYREASRIVASLREEPVSEDELNRARGPLLERIQRGRSSSNQWWLSQLQGVQTSPERIENIVAAIQQYQQISPADIQKAARTYLVEGRAWQMVIMPESAGS